MADYVQRYPYLASSGMVVLITAFGLLAEPILHAANLDTVYLLAVFLSALYCGERPAIFTAILGAIVFNFCFIPPRFSWAVTDLPYLVTLFVFVIVAVVTARVAVQAKQRMLDRAAREHAEALSASKDLLLHKISHELRTPATAVVGWTQFLQTLDIGDDTIRRGLEGLEHSTQLLRRLVDDLLDASRAAAGKLNVQLQPTTLAPVVRNALDIVAVVARVKKVELEASIDDVDALADPARIQQIVTNLTINAIKFTPAGSKVRVLLRRAGTEAAIVVSDNGSGIEPEFLPHLFEPFSQANPHAAGAGLGLGLSIVHYLVEAHHGEIQVSSDGPGRGTTFTVTLPALDRHQPANFGTAA